MYSTQGNGVSSGTVTYTQVPVSGEFMRSCIQTTFLSNERTHEINYIFIL